MSSLSFITNGHLAKAMNFESPEPDRDTSSAPRSIPISIINREPDQIVHYNTSRQPIVQSMPVDVHLHHRLPPRAPRIGSLPDPMNSRRLPMPNLTLPPSLQDQRYICNASSRVARISDTSRSCPADYSFLRQYENETTNNEEQMSSSFTAISVLEGSVESLQQSLGRAIHQSRIRQQRDPSPVADHFGLTSEEEDALVQDFQGVFHFEDEELE